MPDVPHRNRSIRNLTVAITLAAMIMGLALIGTGVAILMHRGLVGVGGGWVAGGAALLVFPALLAALIHVTMKSDANVNRIHHDTLDLLEVLRRIEPQLKILVDNSRISDAARSIANRERERDAVRQAIREELFSGDWEAAHYLIDEFERRFGYKQEAKTLRDEMNQLREMTIEEKITEAIGHITRLMDEYRWDRARQEMDRLLKLFPRNERVAALPQQLQIRRGLHKKELLDKWKLAVERNEIDAGIAILTELDQYLTRSEAEQLKESARGVFKAHLLNLGVQFGLAVSEERWRDALEVGLQIRAEFPNSRMAQEVESKLETLRVRAGFVADADIVQQR